MGTPSLRLKPESYSPRFKHRSDWRTKTFYGLRTESRRQEPPSKSEKLTLVPKPPLTAVLIGVM